MLSPTPFQFTDCLGRTWDLTLTLAIAERVDKSDFSTITDKPICILDTGKADFQLYFHNQRLLAALCFIICKEQWGQLPQVNGTDDNALSVEFAKGFRGNTFASARKALGEALADFFPDLKTIILKSLEQNQKLVDQINAQVTEVTNLAEEMLPEEMQAIFEPLKQALRKKDRKAIEACTKELGIVGETSTVTQPEQLFPVVNGLT